MASISFLWHLHQPAYRTADGVSHAPWVALHAGGTYKTLAGAIEAAGGSGQVLNVVPTLLEQLIAYRDETVTDPVVEALVAPVSELGPAERELLVAWAFHVNPKQLDRYPRLAELARRARSAPTNGRLDSRFGPGDLRDLQVLFVLAQAGDQAWTDERLAPLHDSASNFGAEDHQMMVDWLSAQPGELIEMWRRLSGLDGVEIATSPYAHPIMPLLIDTAIVAESWAPFPAPAVPDFRRPEDAVWQLESGLSYMRERGFDTVGCWPPEGSVSSDAVATYAAAGVRWLVTDEGILERSLGRPLRNGARAENELYRPWLAPGEGPVLFFRDRHLSDAVGFQYGTWEDEGAAARDFVSKLETLSRELPDDAHITIALDGENPWLYYPEAGGKFLREVFGRLNEHPSGLRPTTLDQAAGAASPARLERLHPGSWINSIFATWIGHHEKSRAWEVLAAVRAALDGNQSTDRPPSLALAEGSDWFWWLGDDNPTALAPLYDTIFRRHLTDACEQAGVDSPVDLTIPLKTATFPQRVPMSDTRKPPILDGRITNYFEWSLAEWVEGEEGGPLRRLGLWGSHDRLHLLIESDNGLLPLIENDRLVVRLVTVDGIEKHVVIDETAAYTPDECSVGRVAELSLPWDGLTGSRLDVRLGEWRIPSGGALLLNPHRVDREYGSGRRKDE